MRMIAGKWKGRQIEAPRHDRTRPILDRAKTVLFDVLGHRLASPGELPELAVLDLFAGSGAMGLEALSRGARFGLFVERSRSVVKLIQQNFEKLGVTDEARVAAGDASTTIFPAPPPHENHPSAYELVFVDPPYRELVGTKPSPMVSKLLNRLASESVIAEDALIVVRHGRSPSANVLPDLAPLVEIDRRDVGEMTFRFLNPHRDHTAETSCADDQ